MGIQIRLEDSLHCPRVICDTCGHPIDNCELGNVCFPDESAPVFVHKGACDRSQPKGRQYPWMELRHFILFLCNNVGYRGRVARQALEELRFLAKIGR
jgi:hypothetical protein